MNKPLKMLWRHVPAWLRHYDPDWFQIDQCEATVRKGELVARCKFRATDDGLCKEHFKLIYRGTFESPSLLAREFARIERWRRSHRMTLSAEDCTAQGGTNWSNLRVEPDRHYSEVTAMYRRSMADLRPWSLRPISGCRPLRRQKAARA